MTKQFPALLTEIIERQDEMLDQLIIERDQARAWARAWKRIAKDFRAIANMYHVLAIAAADEPTIEPEPYTEETGM